MPGGQGPRCRRLGVRVANFSSNLVMLRDSLERISTCELGISGQSLVLAVGPDRTGECTQPRGVRDGRRVVGESPHCGAQRRGQAPRGQWSPARYGGAIWRPRLGAQAREQRVAHTAHGREDARMKNSSLGPTAKFESHEKRENSSLEVNRK